MDIAVVTGASSGLGLAISRKLLSLGFRVYGLGGNYQDHPLQNVEFRPIPCDLGDPGLLEHRAREILEREGAVSVLVNNAKLFPADATVDGAGAEFARSLNVNLLCPLILVRTFLPGLQRVCGKVITISSATPETSRGGAVGAASAGGLRWMQESLFQEFRDHGITFSTISPEPNRWRPHDAPRSKRELPQTVINPQAVADALGDIVLNTQGNVATEIVLRPERLTESKIAPMREVPYPKPQPIPYTVPRALIEAEEQLDREEEEQDGKFPGAAAEAEAPQKKRRRRRRRRSGRDEGEEREEAEQETTSRESRERHRERGKRRDSRERRPEQDTRSTSATSPAKAGDGAPAAQPAKPAEDTRETPAASSEDDRSGGRRRRRGRKPRPASREERVRISHEPRPGPVEMKPADQAPKPESTPTTEPPAPAPKPPEAAIRPADEAGDRNAPKKVAPKKVANKKVANKKVAAKKAPTRKNAARKAAAKKSTARKTAAKKTVSKKAASKKTTAGKATKKAATKKLARKSVAKQAVTENP